MMRMVRNIDLPEALILYGRHVLCDPSVDNKVRDGLVALVQECHDVDTAVVVLLDPPVRQQQEDPQGADDDSQQQLHDPGSSSSTIDKDETAAQAWVEALLLPPNKKKKRTAPSRITVLHTTAPPPNPRDLLRALESCGVQERAFGGSSGFGAKPADPSWRPPQPSRCVVLGSSVDVSRAARACGMRVVAILDVDKKDDWLADAVVDEIDFGIDDVATPGSFWLNPPHPRDDEGNKVDPYELVEWYSSTGEGSDQPVAAAASKTTMDDDEFDAILADLAPLK